MALVGDGPPVLTSDLVSTVVIYGQNAFLHVAAVGAGPLSYQWQFEGADLPGATDATLTLAEVGPQNCGRYSVLVSNALGQIRSSEAQFGIVPFIITEHPRDQFASRGGTVTLRAAAESHLPINYQWQFNGTDLPGATSKVLVLSNLQISQSGTYRAVVSNQLAALATASAKVEVGQVVAWGNNDFGQTNLPSGLTNIAAVAAGDYHNLALRADGTVVGWGQIGTPPGWSNITAIAAGGHYNFGLKADGTVVVWGQSELNTVPVGLSNVVAIAAGRPHCLALKRDGRVVAWGHNGDGQTSVPPGLANVVALAGGSQHSLALKADGTVVVWGANDWGQLNVPAGLTNVVAIAAGWQHSLALRADGTMAVWGANYSGATNMPRGITGIIAISAGGHHCLAMRADRTLISWGDRMNPPPSFATDLVMASAGAGHNVAILDSLWPLVVPLGRVEPTNSTLRVIQPLRVINRSPFVYPSVRVHIRGLPPQASVLNAAGLDAEGAPYVQSAGMLAPAASLELQVHYLTLDGSAPNVTLAAEVAMPPTGPLQPISHWTWQPNRQFSLAFDSSDEASYYVQYSHDLRDWMTVYPALEGNGGRVQWNDTGEPSTVSPPATEPQRFYRVILGR